MKPANPCPVCGQPIPERPRGSRHGHPPKTCSEACRKIRASQREKARYHKVKDSEAWKSVRRNYLEKLRAKLAADPEFAALFKAEAAARQREWVKRLAEENPDRHAQIRAEKRAAMAAWRERLMADPEAWEAHKAKCRAWYQSLSTEERARIFYEPRRRRKKVEPSLQREGAQGSSVEEP